jgi:hypothetical protein
MRTAAVALVRLRYVLLVFTLSLLLLAALVLELSKAERAVLVIRPESAEGR